MLALLCNAPPRDGNYDTEVRLSLDGDAWTSTGASYHYHAPLTLVSASPAAGSVDGGVTITVSLRGTASGGSGRQSHHVFGTGFERDGVGSYK